MAKTFCKGHVAVIINNPPILKGRARLPTYT